MITGVKRCRVQRGARGVRAKGRRSEASRLGPVGVAIGVAVKVGVGVGVPVGIGVGTGIPVEVGDEVGVGDKLGVGVEVGVGVGLGVAPDEPKVKPGDRSPSRPRAWVPVNDTVTVCPPRLPVICTPASRAALPRLATDHELTESKPNRLARLALLKPLLQRR